MGNTSSRKIDAGNNPICEKLTGLKAPVVHRTSNFSRTTTFLYLTFKTIQSTSARFKQLRLINGRIKNGLAFLKLVTRPVVEVQALLRLKVFIGADCLHFISG